MVGSATTIFFFPIWGRIAARYGNHPALIASIAALAGYPLFMALTPSVEWMLFVSFWGGAFTPGFSISIFNGLLEVCPEQNRSAYIATFNTLINIAMFAVPLVSSSLTGIIPIQILLLIAAGLRLLGAVAVSR
jgi:MFS family permease